MLICQSIYRKPRNFSTYCTRFICQTMANKRRFFLSASGKRDVYKRQTEQRIRIVEQAIYNTPDIGLVIIDGIRDMVYDINSPGESTRIISCLLYTSTIALAFPFLNKNGIEFKLDAVDFLRDVYKRQV